MRHFIESLENGLALADVARLSDADLDRFERSTYYWQQAAFAEQCRREAARIKGVDDAERGIELTTGQGKTFSGVLAGGGGENSHA
jgi:hypothetical protein